MKYELNPEENEVDVVFYNEYIAIESTNLHIEMKDIEEITIKRKDNKVVDVILSGSKQQ